MASRTEWIWSAPVTSPVAHPCSSVSGREWVGQGCPPAVCPCWSWLLSEPAPWDLSVHRQWERWATELQARSGTWHRGWEMQSQLVPIITRNGYCVANSKVYSGLQSTVKSLLFYRMFHTTQWAQGHVKIPRMPGNDPVLYYGLCILSRCVSCPCFALFASKDHLPKQPHSSLVAFEAGLRGLPGHTGLVGQLQECVSISAWGSSSPPGEAGNPPALQFQECLAKPKQNPHAGISPSIPRYNAKPNNWN